ncbi:MULTISPECIES: 3-isopropylmalate dehydratase small subunit [Thermotoga]|jgi:3-isopropylmalate/(R)-2-methylmalate dehydratase small subunit|uniref:3-isopropylmalate dehydratase small subunit n=1 Tax=Thermotoga neapolitana (strain ATCC 49049 / DSM 4359 / NBRC 107923 / NS-E) TaxID=309803 RepID=B9KC21_THENN|nr:MULTISPECIES: 3-isopropylmalate dehydratase small subunit [Thermotoga]ACM22568.1 3-isopropylmalate dehydratase small subunit 1 [Thermotoga neapolitana DSM 4359]AJG40503.1 3-isopropylmalate dehydratase [Thermotoga sp. RQ7]KFZ22212.1 3-isopropylmalate dehydratase small subunit [Thermotoga neapolitana LA10]HBF10485.1 3-isopropylmalate dehydratase small subunit [Thermotoga neapolitana]
MIRGRVWKFGDNISTDHIAPGRYFHLRNNLEELAKHVLEDAMEDFAKKVQKGDIIVAGKNFGLGSSREHAARIIKIAGVSCIVAKSFARIFYRNAINVGLPVIELKEVDEINQGDELEIDLENGVLKNLTTGKEYRFNPIPKFLLGILKEDGIVNYLKKHGTFPKV